MSIYDIKIDLSDETESIIFDDSERLCEGQRLSTLSKWHADPKVVKKYTAEVIRIDIDPAERCTFL